MIYFNNIRVAEGISDMLDDLKEKVEQKINLQTHHLHKPVGVSQNMLFRSCFVAGLSLSEKRLLSEIEELRLTTQSTIHDTVFTKANQLPLWSALLKLRYRDSDADLDNPTILRKAINYEIKRGASHLLNSDNLDAWLLNNQASIRQGSYGLIPELNLRIGTYEDDIPATLDLNSTQVPNTQILIAGTTGSGKSNLLAVLVREIRTRSIDTSYPVNFLLFDYKGEFSDPANHAWLGLFEVDRTSILNPLESPLPFNPFKDFTRKTQNEINLYATELAQALAAIDATKISANMSNRLAEAIIQAYKKTRNKPVNFKIIFDEYTNKQPEKERDNDDSVKSVLKQLIRTNLFSDTDKIDLIRESLIIKMDSFPKEGPVAKAIVYFIVSKLNACYEQLPKQALSDNLVELRHFTIIDEAHYMLGFDNKPLRDLIAVGRNKGMSIILATQNMESFKSDHFDFFANAQYPLIMKQQSINDGVIKDLFGVSGKEFQEVREAIIGLQKGELIIKNASAITLGLGKKYKKIRVSHLI